VSRTFGSTAAALLLVAPVLLCAADASVWDALLKKYVNEHSRVDYRRWKAEGTAGIEAYINACAQPGAAPDKADLINAYNALTVTWVLKNYPAESIWRTVRPFTEARHVLRGEKVSLDAIETRLRNMGDPRIHGALVCAARSCPPLRREAYTAAGVNAQLDANMRDWLGNQELNQFYPERQEAAVSMIFKWYRGDFNAAAGSVAAFLARYKPGDYKNIRFNTYHWGLNDASDLGKDYSTFDFLKDKVKSAL